jgi:hypothetical protein
MLMAVTNCVPSGSLMDVDGCSTMRLGMLDRRPQPRVQLHYGQVTIRQRVLYVQMRALLQDLREFFLSVSQKIRFAVVMTCKRMSSLDDPINVVRNVGKEFTSVAGFKSVENIANLRKSS